MTPKDNIHIGKNIKHLRKLRGLTQQDLADILAIRRSNIGAYEEGRATPRYETLQSMAKHFEISVDRLLSEDLTKLSEKEIRESNQKPGDKNGTTARIIAITVDKQGKDNVTLVPVKASAGYLNGYADPEYFDSLPTLSLPMLGPGSFRGFEIKGDSMNPLPEGSIVVGELVESLDQIKDGQTYVVVSDTEGIVYKRVFQRKISDGNIFLRLVSDNVMYEPYEVSASDVREVWKAKTFILNEMPVSTESLSMDKLYRMVRDLQDQVSRIKGK